MKKILFTIIFFYLIIYILPLGIRPLFLPDETRYGEIPREMLTSGDWVVPRLAGVRYFEKPVLGYWLNAFSIKIFGENAFALRLPSAVAVGISALLLFLLLRKFADGHSSRLLATAMFLTCAEVFGVGIFCVLDSVFSMFVTASIVSGYFALEEDSPGKKSGYLSLCGICMGLAFLTKGFIAFVVVISVISTFMLWERRWRELLRYSWLPLLTAILVALPWSLLIYFRDKNFWYYFFWTEHVMRFISPSGEQHANPFWFYIPVIAGGALPWAIFLPLLISDLRNTVRKDRLVRFAICWFLLPFIFFSLSNGKLGTYILPCFPPLVILITKALHNYFRNTGTKFFNRITGIIATILAIAIVILILLQTIKPGWGIYHQAETWKWTLAVAGSLVYVVFLILAGKKADYRQKLACYCLGPLAMMFLAHFIMPERLLERKTPGDFLLSQASKIQPDAKLVSIYYLVPSVSWFYKRNDVYLLGRAGEMSYGLSHSDARHRHLDFDGFKKLVQTNRDNTPIVLIIRTSTYGRFKPFLPKPSSLEISEDNYMLVSYK